MEPTEPPDPTITELPTQTQQVTTDESDNSYFFPHIPEDTKREEFQLHEWNGFAVSEKELEAIEALLANDVARKSYAERYEKGKGIRTDNDVVDGEKIDPTTMAVRCDGVLFFLDAMQEGHLQSSDDPQVQTRQKGEGLGIFMTALKDFDTNRSGKISQVTPVSSEERQRRLTDSSGVYGLTSFTEVANDTLLPQARNEIWREMMSHYLRTQGSLGGHDNLFKYEGQAFVTYMQRVLAERGSVLWGINQTTIDSGRYRYGHGDFGRNSMLAEMDVKGENGVQLEDIAFIAARPGSLEDRIGIACVEHSETDQKA